MKSIVCCIHWTLLVVSIISCSCLLALVVSCEGTSKSIDGPSTGITGPTHLPSALPKTTHLVSSSNNPDFLEEKTTDVKDIFLNGSAIDFKSDGDAKPTVDTERGGHSVYNDAAKIQHISKDVENIPVAEIHSSFEESVLETKQCVSCRQESEESIQSKSDRTESFSSNSRARFIETKDASIMEPVVEMGKAPDDKHDVESLPPPPPNGQLDFQSKKVPEEETNATEIAGVEENEPSSYVDLGSVAVPQIIATSKSTESEQTAKVGSIELTSQKESDKYVVRAEPKVVEAKRTSSDNNEVRSNSESDEKVLKDDGSVIDKTEPKLVEVVYNDAITKTDGQLSESVKGKESVNINKDPVTSDDSPASTSEPPSTPSSTSEDMPSFSEWTQKRLEEAERRKVLNDTSGQGGSDGSGSASSHGSGGSGGSSNGGSGAGGSVSGASSASGSSSTGNSGEINAGSGGSGSGSSKVRLKNYASPDCGAKIAASNPEAVSPGSVLSPSRDEYLLNACSSRIWFVVELCEAIRAKKIELANFELFSSSPKDFSVWVSDRFPTRDWSLVGRFTAQDERTLQSFHLDPHLFTKFIRVELHSHYGSEHFCPVSLFRVYGTSEFEVLETEEDGENGGGRSGDSSGSLIGEDDGEDSDEEEPLDIETGGPPRNLFGSARDAVMSIVKKAAEALVKAGDSANETITLATESPIKEDIKNETSEPASDGEESNSSLDDKDERVSECKTLRRPPVCHGCEEAVILRAAALLSCHYDTLRPLSSSPFVRSALASGGLCMTRFGLPLSAPNHSSSTTATDGGYISALLPTEYLVALCNALITPDMVRDSDPLLPDPPVADSTYLAENQTISVTLESRRVKEGQIIGDPPAVASMIKPTKTLKGDGVESGGRGESAHDVGSPEEVSSGSVMSSPILESPQSTSMPSFAHIGTGPLYRDSVEGGGSEESVTVEGIHDGATSIVKQEPIDLSGEWMEKESEASLQDNPESDVIGVISPVNEPVGGVVIPTTSSPVLSANPSATTSSSSLPQVQLPVPVADNVVTPSKDTASSNTVPSTPPSQTGSGQAVKGAEASSSLPPPPPSAAIAQKESVFVRLSNRIKILERNMSLSAQYLEELSRRYRKQFEEAQKHSVEAQKRDRRLAEDAANLQARLDILAEAVKGLLDARKREEDQRMKEKEEEEAKRKKEQEFGENFPWWGAILIWAWGATGRAAVAVAQHAVIFCVELMVLWAVMGQYQRRRWGWSSVPSAPLVEDVHQNLEVDMQRQLKYGSARKRRKWAAAMKEEDWTESTEMGRSPRKRRPTNEDIRIDSISEPGVMILDPSVGQLNHKPRRRRRKLKSSSTTSLSSYSPHISLSAHDPQFPPPYSATHSFVPPSPVENLNGWTWPCHGTGNIQRASILEEGFQKPELPKDDPPSKTVGSERSSPKSGTDETTREGLGKSKSRRVSAPLFFPDDNGTLTKNADTSSPLSRSSSQIHSSLRICSPKLKADNWEWFTGARVSGGDSTSKSSRAASSTSSRNGNSSLPTGEGLCSPETASGQQTGSSSPTPSGSGKNKDKKNGAGGGSGSGGGGSSFKRIVKRFF